MRNGILVLGGIIFIVGLHIFSQLLKGETEVTDDNPSPKTSYLRVVFAPDWFVAFLTDIASLRGDMEEIPEEEPTVSATISRSHAANNDDQWLRPWEEEFVEDDVSLVSSNISGGVWPNNTNDD